MAKKANDTFYLQDFVAVFGIPEYEYPYDLGIRHADARRAAEREFAPDDFEDEDEYEQAVNELAETLRQEAAERASAEHYRDWASDTIGQIERYLERGGLELVELPKGKYRVRPAPGNDWRGVAGNILTVINGLGYYGHMTLSEWLEDTPRNEVLRSMHYLGDAYDDVYGGGRRRRRR